MYFFKSLQSLLVMTLASDMLCGLPGKSVLGALDCSLVMLEAVLASGATGAATAPTLCWRAARFELLPLALLELAQEPVVELCPIM